jgi:exopolysaccharide production protein ExoZ
MLKSTQLKGIQFGRGVAACLVVLFHAGHQLALPQYVGHPFSLTSLFRFGNSGVDFFFVLSGFIIFHVHSVDIGRPRRLAHYVRQRLTRIYPIYWIVTAFVIATLVAKHDWPALDIFRVIKSILLLPDTKDPILGPAWTLIHEMAFYSVFAVAIISVRAGLVVAAAALALTFVNVQNPTPIVALFQSPLHYEFAMGVFAAFAVQRSWLGPAWLLGAIGLIVFVVGAWLVNAGHMPEVSDPARMWFGFASFFLITALAKAELAGQLKVPALGNYLGAASYSVYLVHVIVLGLAARLLFHFRLAHDLPEATALLICLAALVAGCVLHSAVEMPLLKAIRRIVKRSAVPA